MGGDLTDALAAAEAALAAVAAHPGQAAAAARQVLAGAGRDPETASVAHRTLALAAAEQGDLGAALRSAASAVRAAERAGVADRVAQAVCTQAGVLMLAGRRERAMARIAEAVAVAGPAVRPDLLAQQATLLLRSGRHREAVRAAQEALALGGGPPDPDVLVTLGGALLELGELDAAGAAFVAAADGYRALGADYAAAMCEHNRAVLAVRQGRVPAALASFAHAAAELDALGLPPAYVLSGEVAALLEAGLVDEAWAAAERGMAATERSELNLRAVMLLLAARSALAAGAPAEASRVARAAAAAYRRLGDAGGGASSRLLAALAIEPSSSAATGRQVAVLASIGAELAAAGRVGDAVGAHAEAVRRGLRAGLPPGAVAASVDAVRRLRPRSTGLARAAGFEAEARAHLAARDLAGCRRAAAAGLDVVDAFRSGWAGTELRAQASRHGTGLADVALAAALSTGSPAEVLAWSERWRAAGVRRPPVASPDLADLLAALRRARADAEALVAAGEHADASLREVAQLEAGLRRAARQVAAEEPGVRAGARERPLPAVRAALGEHVLVEVVEHAGALHAVVVGSRRATLHHLGPVAPVLAEVDGLGFALRRLGRAGASPASLASAMRSAAASLAALDTRLLAPLRRSLAGRPVVVVPTAALHAVPWPALPSLAGRPVSVAPSSRWWAAAVAGGGGTLDAPALLAAGPGLPGARVEVEHLAGFVPSAAVLAAGSATPDEVVARLPRARLAHLACHGHFRSDNPMCSALQLDGGQLTVYDLETAGRTPPLVVLSACDSGVPATRPGDELLGLTAALVSLGSRAVVASVVAVPDLDAAPLMVAFHRAVAAGTGPAEALQQAVGTLDPDVPSAFATRCAFVCFGAG